MSHTPGPWRSGVTLITPQTKTWTPEQFTANDFRERLCVYAFFTSEDQGRGRRLVATCTLAGDVPLVTAAPDLLAEVKQQFKREFNPFEPNNQSEAYHRMAALIVKAEGGK